MVWNDLSVLDPTPPWLRQDLNMTEGETRHISLSDIPFFSPQPIRRSPPVTVMYSARSSRSSHVSVSVLGDQLTINALSSGTAEITVFADVNEDELEGCLYLADSIPTDGHFRVIVTAAQSTGPGTPTPGSGDSALIFRIKDGCNDGYRINYRLFAYSSSDDLIGQWPGGNQHYFTRRYDETYEHRLDCTSVHKVCYGGETGDRSWGSASMLPDAAATVATSVLPVVRQRLASEGLRAIRHS